MGPVSYDHKQLAPRTPDDKKEMRFAITLVLATVTINTGASAAEPGDQPFELPVPATSPRTRALSEIAIRPEYSSRPAKIRRLVEPPAAPAAIPDVPTIQVEWTAPNLCYRSTYFTDTKLERYGNTNSPLFQPAISGLRFATQTTLFPFQLLRDPPRKLHPTSQFQPPR